MSPRTWNLTRGSGSEIPGLRARSAHTGIVRAAKNLRKPHLATRARWLSAMGFSHACIAWKLKVHRNSVDAWCRDRPSRHALARLKRRVDALSPADRLYVTGAQ